MSSREIAELTVKQHAHVLRDIRAMLAELGEDERGYLQKWTHPQNGQEYDEFILNRELTDCLLTGYSAVARMRVIKRWHQLDGIGTKRTTRLPSPVVEAEKITAAYMRVAKMFKVPSHLAQTIAVNETRKQTGVDFTPLLLESPAMDSVKPAEVFLEPTELGEMYGINARAMNMRLAAAGLQKQITGGWEPLGDAKKNTVKHPWVSGNKSGYNWKWRVEFVKARIQ